LDRRIALDRLMIALCERHGWNIYLNREPGAREVTMMVKRPDRKPVEFPPHPTALVLDLLTGIAKLGTAIGGAGLTQKEINDICRLETREERELRRRREA
jgi:hypothetical protein